MSTQKTPLQSEPKTGSIVGLLIVHVDITVRGLKGKMQVKCFLLKRINKHWVLALCNLRCDWSSIMIILCIKEM